MIVNISAWYNITKNLVHVLAPMRPKDLWKIRITQRILLLSTNRQHIKHLLRVLAPITPVEALGAIKVYCILLHASSLGLLRGIPSKDDDLEPRV